MPRTRPGESLGEGVRPMHHCTYATGPPATLHALVRPCLTRLVYCNALRPLQQSTVPHYAAARRVCRTVAGMLPAMNQSDKCCTTGTREQRHSTQGRGPLVTSPVLPRAPRRHDRQHKASHTAASTQSSRPSQHYSQQPQCRLTVAALTLTRHHPAPLNLTQCLPPIPPLLLTCNVLSLIHAHPMCAS